MKLFYVGENYEGYGKYELGDKETFYFRDNEYWDVEWFRDGDGEFITVERWIDEGDGDWYVPMDGISLFQVVE